jgi:DNA-binding LacI/PurR family transcriptional regulator
MGQQKLVSAIGGRLRGFRRTLEKAGRKYDPEYIVDGGRENAAGYRAMKELVRLKRSLRNASIVE